jgi:hypothetical protein
MMLHSTSQARRVFAVVFWLATSSASTGQATKLHEDMPPAAMVRVAVDRELAAARDTRIKHLFRSRRTTPRGSQTKLYAETNDAIVGLVIAENDVPVSASQQQSEIAHLERIVGNRDEMRRKQKQEHEDAERTLRIVRALPDAFVYQYDGTEPGQENIGRAGGEFVRLKFRPNPHYAPPSRVEQVLQGMQGSVLIDPTECRLARIQASLFRQVSFGWGILGHLDKGGSFLVEKSDLGDGIWDLRRIRLSFTGKIMMVKSLVIKSDEIFDDYRKLPENTTFAKGIEVVREEQARLQSGGAARESASRHRK